MKSNRRSRKKTLFSRAIRIDPLESRTLLAATRIMPLGDSITESFGGHASYRWSLYNQLTAAGYSVDFVGGQTGVTAGSGSPLYSNFDQNHEGHSGWRTDQIRDNIINWATANPSDIVLLHTGSNDIEQGNTNDSTITEISQTIDNLRSVLPNVKILLAQIIPENTKVAQYPDLNNKIATLASQKTTAQSPIILVDQYTGFNNAADTFDGIHPDDSGERKMANKWFAALQGILPAPTPPAPVTYLSSLTPSSSSNGWGPIENDLSNGETGSGDGRIIGLNSIGYLRGLGTHAASDARYNLPAGFTEFRADIGVDDEQGNAGSVVFQVYVDGVLKYTSPTMTGSSTTVSIAVPIANASQLRLVVTDAGNGNTSDHADWANARLIPTAGPNAPSGLSATPASSEIDLSWTDNSGNENGFKVERKTGAGGTYGFLADLAAGTTSYADTTAVQGITYYYHVYSYNGQGNSTFSNEASAAIPAPPPADPTGLDATANGQQVNLIWTDNAGNEAGYKVERKTGAGGIYSQIADLAANTQAYTDTTAPGGATYFYRVYAYNSGGPSGYSNEDSATIAAPTVIYVSDLNWTSMSNGWGSVEKDHSNGENGSTDGKTITLNGQTYAKGLGVHAPSTITYNLNSQYAQFLCDIGVDDEVGSNGSVVFQVFADNVAIYTSTTMTGTTATKQIAVDVSGKSQLKLVVTDSGNGNAYDHADWANARLTVAQLPPPPDAPTGATANYNNGSVTVNWTDVATNETNYIVERKLGAGGTYSTIATLGANAVSYVDNGPFTPNSTYFYRVSATNLGGTTPGVDEPSINTPAGPTQVFLSDLNWASATNGWGPVEKDKSNGENGSGDGHAISIRGQTYAKGLGAHSLSTVIYNLGGQYSSFVTDMGVDDEVGGNGRVNFQIYVDNVLQFDSGAVLGTSAVVSKTVSVVGASQLKLVITDGGNGNAYDHADWAGAKLVF